MYCVHRVCLEVERSTPKIFDIHLNNYFTLHPLKPKTTFDKKVQNISTVHQVVPENPPPPPLNLKGFSYVQLC